MAIDRTDQLSENGGAYFCATLAAYGTPGYRDHPPIEIGEAVLYTEPAPWDPLLGATYSSALLWSCEYQDVTEDYSRFVGDLEVYDAGEAYVEELRDGKAVFTVDFESARGRLLVTLCPGVETLD